MEEAVRALRTSSRRKQVLDAAVQDMQRIGFHQMSMQALADEAGVSVELIYKYFGGKEEITRGQRSAKWSQVRAFTRSYDRFPLRCRCRGR